MAHDLDTDHAALQQHQLKPHHHETFSSKSKSRNDSYLSQLALGAHEYDLHPPTKDYSLLTNIRQ